jgi:hypothetical protein
MTLNLDTTVASTSKSKRAATSRTAARQAEATLKPAPAPTPPARQHVKTILVASCGWPTDATPPARRRTAKR